MAHKIIIGSPEFNVDLHQLEHAIVTVQHETTALRGDEATVMQLCTTIEGAWQSPAGFTFPPLQKDLQSAFNTLLELLDQMMLKMKATHANYVKAEEANARNLAKIKAANEWIRNHPRGHRHQPAGHHPVGHQPPAGHHPAGHQPAGHQPAGHHQPLNHHPAGHRPVDHGHQPDGNGHHAAGHDHDPAGHGHDPRGHDHDPTRRDHDRAVHDHDRTGQHAAGRDHDPTGRHHDPAASEHVPAHRTGSGRRPS